VIRYSFSHSPSFSYPPLNVPLFGASLSSVPPFRRFPSRVLKNHHKPHCHALLFVTPVPCCCRVFPFFWGRILLRPASIQLATDGAFDFPLLPHSAFSSPTTTPFFLLVNFLIFLTFKHVFSPGLDVFFFLGLSLHNMINLPFFDQVISTIFPSLIV